MAKERRRTCAGPQGEKGKRSTFKSKAWGKQVICFLVKVGFRAYLLRVVYSQWTLLNLVKPTLEDWKPGMLQAVSGQFLGCLSEWMEGCFLCREGWPLNTVPCHCHLAVYTLREPKNPLFLAFISFLVWLIEVLPMPQQSVIRTGGPSSVEGCASDLYVSVTIPSHLRVWADRSRRHPTYVGRERFQSSHLFSWGNFGIWGGGEFGRT